ncbi:hypothetical protein OSTOST_09750 [Ostertagia ostertagi]
MYNVFDGLVTINFKDRSIMPNMALEWTNPDPLTWRIKIREGVKWQKGFGEFTAEDVEYTYNFHISSKSFQMGTSLFPIASVKSDGKYVVEVKTKMPFGAFPGVTMGYDLQQQAPGLRACAAGVHRETRHRIVVMSGLARAEG